MNIDYFRFKTNIKLIKTLYLLILMISIIQADQSQYHQSSKIYQIKRQQHNTWDNISVSQSFQHLNQQIQTLDKDFITHFLSLYHVQKSKLLEGLNDQNLAMELNVTNIKQQPGNYILLLAKMYLYDLLPQSKLTQANWKLFQTDSRYIMAYFYLKIAAQKYANPQAYYYLAILDFYKINPHSTFISNLEKEVNIIVENQGYEKIHQTKYQQLLDYLRNQRFASVQHNLFMGSMLGHHGSGLVLANMFKQGLGTEKNCTTALAYYLRIIKDTYVDQYEFRSSYSDDHNFQKQLYSKKKLSFQNEQNVYVVESTQFFDTVTIKATYELAENYFIGRGGFQKNYQKAAQLYAKLAAQDHKNSMAMLGMCYFKGQGVPIDRKRARVLFQHSSKISISQAMLIVMDYFQIQSKGNRDKAIKKMRQLYNKKKQSMNTIIKYLFGSLIIKGDIKELKTDEGVLLLGSAAKQGHLMAKVAMGLLFADGIDINYDCIKAINYFADQGMSHPFFMDKFNLARIGMKKNMKTFALVKYLQLTLVGNTNAFVNSLYLIEIEKKQSLGLNQNSWNIKMASSNLLYKKLKSLMIVPDMHSYLLKQYSFMGHKIIKYGALERFLEGDNAVLEDHLYYIKRKIVKVCSLTKQSSLMNFYEYKMTKAAPDPTILNQISKSGDSSKLHILESRYLLGQYHHRKSFESLSKGKDHTKDQYNAIKQYKRATNSQFVGILLFYLQQILLNPYGLNFNDSLFQFEFIDDLLVYTFILSIVIFVLYYKRSKKLDQIHKKELQKRQQQNRIKNEEEQFKRKFQPNDQQKNGNDKKVANKLQQEVSPHLMDQNQPQIIQQIPLKGYIIGSSQQQQDDGLVIRQVYNFQQTNKTQMKKQQTQFQQQNNEQYSHNEKQKDL